MSETNKRLEKIERQLQVISGDRSLRFGSGSSGQSDEIDLRELFAILWLGKYWVVGITALFAVAGVLYALSLPNMYKSEGVYAAVKRSDSVGGISGQLGGLAAVAGISIGGGESDDVEQALAILKGWPFLGGLVEKHGLQAEIIGVKGWNSRSNEVVWDLDVYSPDTGWIDGKPTSYEVYKRFKEYMSVSRDAKTGLVSISVEYYVPEISERWVSLLLSEINQYFQSRDYGEAEASIEYLERKISETGLGEIRTIFYGMIEAQTKTMMLAAVADEYLLRTVVPPKTPESKSNPKRMLIVFMSVFLGVVFGVLIYLVRYFSRKSERKVLGE